jgi:hypothetical protein
MNVENLTVSLLNAIERHLTDTQGQQDAHGAERLAVRARRVRGQLISSQWQQSELRGAQAYQRCLALTWIVDRYHNLEGLSDARTHLADAVKSLVGS